MKILICHNYYRQRGGGEDSEFLAESAIMREAGHHVLQYTRRNDEITEQHLFSKLKLGLGTTWARNSIEDLRGILRKEKPDIVHFHNTFPLISPGAYYACQETGVPVIQTLQNYRLLCPAGNLYRDGEICEECMDSGVFRGVMHGCYHDSHLATAAIGLMLALHRGMNTWTDLVDSYVVPTEFARRKLIESELPAEKIRVKSNLVYPDPGMRARAGEYALFVGRLVPEKGVRTLLKSFRILGNAIPLRIVGDGPLRHELEEQKCRENLSSVRFEGWLARKQTLEIISGARFLIFPSEWLEPFGISIIEAFACGVPVIASRLGAQAEIVEDGKTGAHFTAGDPDDLAVKVQWAWEHPTEMEVKGRAARGEYEAKYTARRNYQLLMEIYGRTKNARN